MSIFNPHSTTNSEFHVNPGLTLLDTTFKVIAELGILDNFSRLFGLERELRKNPITSEMVRTGQLVYTAVNSVFVHPSADLTIGDIFSNAGDQPTAVITMPDKKMFIVYDERQEGEPIDYCKTAIVGALQKAVTYQKETGADQPWDLRHVRLFTNIADIGPAAYSGTLLCNVGAITVATDFDSEGLELKAREIMGHSNTETFRQAIASVGGTNMAQLLWNTIMAADETSTSNQESCLGAAHPLKAKLGVGRRDNIIPNQVVTSGTENRNKNVPVVKGLRN